MHITGLATTACLAVYVSGTAAFTTGTPNRKRQGGLLDGVGFAGGEGTRTSVYLPRITSTTILAPLIPHATPTTTRALLPNLGDILFPPGGPTTITSSVSSTVSPTRTRSSTSSSSTKPAVVLSTSTSNSVVSSSTGSTVPDITPWKPTPSPSPTSSAGPASATSANSTWKTVGIAVSVITLIGLTMLLVIFFDRWTGFVRDVCLCRRSRRDQDPLGDEDFLPDKHYEDYDAGIRNHNGKWAREIRESARLSNIRYPTGVFFGDGGALGPGKAGVGAGGSGGRREVEAGEFGQLDRPSRPSFLQRLSILSLRAPSGSPRFRMKTHSPDIENTGDGFAASTLSPPKMSPH